MKYPRNRGQYKWNTHLVLHVDFCSIIEQYWNDIIVSFFSCEVQGSSLTLNKKEIFFRINKRNYFDDSSNNYRARSISAYVKFMYNECTGERNIIIKRWSLYLISCIDGTSVFNQQVGDLDVSFASRVVKTILPILEKYFLVKTVLPILENVFIKDSSSYPGKIFYQG